MKKLFLAALLAALTLPAAAYEPSNFKLSLWDRTAVAAPNANLDDISGVDLGIGSYAETVDGVQYDFVFANTNDRVRGWQHAWLVAFTGNFSGLQSAAFSRSESFQGAQLSLLNLTTRTATGAQLGFVNLTDSVTGAQVSFVNVAQYVHGAQVGFVNYAKTIDGLQVGLLNIAGNGWFPAMVFVNGRF